MSYLGKVFKFDREENVEEFFDALHVPESVREGLKQFRPDQTLVAHDDGSFTFTTSSPKKTKDLTFRAGEEFDEELAPGRNVKTVFTMSGDVLTQVQEWNDGRRVTYAREFSDDALKVTITASFAEGSAIRYYKCP